MKVGLLVCDQVDEPYREQYGDYPDMFQSLLPKLELVPYAVHLGEYPGSPEKHRAWIITGSRRSAYEDLSWIEWLKSFIPRIVSSDARLVGICFGHQIIAQALGGEVTKNEGGWMVGSQAFKLTVATPWMLPSRSRVRILMMCQDQVTKLPDTAEILATNPGCPIGMYRMDDQVFCMQGHPEFSEAYDRVLMTKRRERMGNQVVKEGIDSLVNAPDRAILSQWITSFVSTT